MSAVVRGFFGNCPYGHLGRHCWHRIGGGKKRCCCCEATR